jgi:FkbM family methyltransferase
LNREHIVAQFLLRSWPFPRGAGRLLDTFFANTKFSDPVCMVQTTDGFQISVAPNDLIGRHLYLTGEFDRSTVEVLCTFGEPGDALLDIGANIGYVTACFLNNVSGSTAVAVEPQPVIVDLLRQNLSQFAGRQNVFPFALSDRDGEAHFRINQANKGASRIVETETMDSIRVPIKSASAFFNEPALSKVDVVKIDVEGHEETILSAAKVYLAKLQPKIILFEEHGVKCAPGNSIAKIFDEIGFDLYGIHKRLTKLDLRPIRGPADCSCNDFLAVSRTRPMPQKAKVSWTLMSRT